MSNDSSFHLLHHLFFLSLFSFVLFCSFLLFLSFMAVHTLRAEPSDPGSTCSGLTPIKSEATGACIAKPWSDFVSCCETVGQTQAQGLTCAQLPPTTQQQQSYTGVTTQATAAWVVTHCAVSCTKLCTPQNNQEQTCTCSTPPLPPAFRCNPEGYGTLGQVGDGKEVPRTNACYMHEYPVCTGYLRHTEATVGISTSVFMARQLKLSPNMDNSIRKYPRLYQRFVTNPMTGYRYLLVLYANDNEKENDQGRKFDSEFLSGSQPLHWTIAAYTAYTETQVSFLLYFFFIVFFFPFYLYLTLSLSLFPYVSYVSYVSFVSFVSFV